MKNSSTATKPPANLTPKTPPECAITTVMARNTLSIPILFPLKL